MKIFSDELLTKQISVMGDVIFDCGRSMGTMVKLRGDKGLKYTSDGYHDRILDSIYQLEVDMYYFISLHSKCVDECKDDASMSKLYMIDSELKKLLVLHRAYVERIQDTTKIIMIPGGYANVGELYNVGSSVNQSLITVCGNALMDAALLQSMDLKTKYDNKSQDTLIDQLFGISAIGVKFNDNVDITNILSAMTSRILAEALTSVEGDIDEDNIYIKRAKEIGFTIALIRLDSVDDDSIDHEAVEPVFGDAEGEIMIMLLTIRLRAQIKAYVSKEITPEGIEEEK